MRLCCLKSGGATVFFWQPLLATPHKEHLALGLCAVSPFVFEKMVNCT
jgi:hypothetical protein